MITFYSKIQTDFSFLMFAFHLGTAFFYFSLKILYLPLDLQKTIFCNFRKKILFNLNHFGYQMPWNAAFPTWGHWPNWVRTQTFPSLYYISSEIKVIEIIDIKTSISHSPMSLFGLVSTVSTWLPVFIMPFYLMHSVNGEKYKYFLNIVKMANSFSYT